MENVTAVLMLAISWMFGMAFFYGGCILVLTKSKRARKWLVDASMKWCNEITVTMLDSKEDEES